jgi:peptide deformylase
MAILEIQVGENTSVLRQKAEQVKKIDADLLQLIQDMFEAMHAAQGIGLAAPQVGVSERVIVIDVEEYHPEILPIALINPMITGATGEELGEEGCLSLPGYRGIVRRAMDVTAKGLLSNGHKIEFEASGLMARVLQHEIDHLDGVLFIDRLIPEDQKLLDESQPRSRPEPATELATEE